MSTQSEGPAGLEFWAGGDVSSENIGPAAGPHLLGRVDEPGLYFWIASNTAGKSTHLRMLAKLQKERLLRSDAAITDGADSASLQFALARVTFRRLPDGTMADPTRQGVETLPRIEELPAPIDALITGLGRKGDEERAKARLEALLTYVPIPSSAELVAQLCRAVEGRGVAQATPAGPQIPGGMLTVDPGPERRALWDRLAGEAKERSKRLRVEPFRTTAEILDWLLDQPREGILQDHEHLVDILNATANAAEKIAEGQALAVAKAQGAIYQAVEAAGRRLDRTNDTGLAAALRRRAEQQAPNADSLAAQRERAAELRAGNTARRAEVERREALRAQHGERPDSAPAGQAVTAAEEALRAADEEFMAAGQELAVAKQQLADAAPRSKAARERVFGLWEKWRTANQHLDVILFGENRTLAVEADTLHSPTTMEMGAAVAAVRTTALDLQDGYAAARPDLVGEEARAKAVATAERELEQKAEAVTTARVFLEARAADLREIAGRSMAWAATAALLAEEVPGPTDADVDAAATAVRVLEQDQLLWTAAQDYAAAALGHEQEVATLGWFQAVAADYRRAVADSWKVLGTLITEQLGLPWLRVLNGQLFIGYNGSGSGASLATGAAADWRNLDDQERVSKAELHEAVLKLMIEKRERQGGILIIPDQTLYPLDEARLSTFSGWARAAGIWIFSERPRRKGDPLDLVLEYVTPAQS